MQVVFRQLMRVGFVAACALTFTLAVMPGNPGISSYDKANHGLAFVTLGLLLRLGWMRASAWWQAAGLIAFGGLIELVQALPIVARDASWADLFADAIATFGGLALATIALRWGRLNP